MKLDEAIQMKNVLENEIVALLMEFTKETGLVASISSEHTRERTEVQWVYTDHYDVEAEVKI